MKKLAAVVLVAVLSFGWTVPAFAAGPHHGAEHCLNYSEFCQNVAQKALAPGIQSLSERMSAVLAQVSERGTANASGPQVDLQMTSPSLCARGACGLYLDADGDGVCDYHGESCTNMGGASAGYGSHHGSGHHGGYHH